MLRSGAARSLARSVANHTNATRHSFGSTSVKLQSFTQNRALSYTNQRSLALTLHKPALTSLRRYATNTKDGVDAELEKKAAREKLQSNPKEVSLGSSVRQVFHEKGVEDPKKEEDMMAGIKADVVSFLSPVITQSQQNSINNGSREQLRRPLHSQKHLRKL